MEIAVLVPALVQIVLYNLILSGDNAVVIGMAAHLLPARQRRFAIVFGAVAAVVLRVVLTLVAAALLQVPAVKLVGGILLVFIAFRLLEENEAKLEGVKGAETLRSAIWTIVVADLVMSLDNVLAIAAVAQGNTFLLMFGLVLSMPIVMLAGGLVAGLLDKLVWLAYVGSALIGWTGAEMALDDAVVAPFVPDLELVHLLIPILVAAVTLAAGHFFHRHIPRARAAARLAQPLER